MTKEEFLKLRNYDKTYMLTKILKELDIEPENVLFFDNCYTHCLEATKIGIKYVLVDSYMGITWKDVEAGLKLFE